MSLLTGHAQVSLHPVASRHGTTSSTLVAVNSPSTDPRHHQQSRDELADRDDGQGTPRLHRSSPQRSWSRPNQQRSPSPKSLPQAAESFATEQPCHGIHHVDLEDYPVIYDEALPSDSSSDDDDQADHDDDDTFDDGFHRNRRADSTRNAPRPHLFKRQLTAPIRAMSAEQLAHLHQQYVSQDVPHNIVFPFLHGVDGSIPAQNYFFGAPLSGQPAPAYRGLTVLRADMPTRHEMEQIYASNPAYTSGRSRARTFSSVTTQSSGSSPDTDDESARFEPSWTIGSKSPPPFGFAAPTAVDSTMPTAGSSASASPSTVSTVSSQASRPSLFSSESYSSGSRTSVSTASDIADECAHATAKHVDSARFSEDFERQPRRSILNSTVFPAEVIKPPSIRRTMYGRNFYDDLSEGGLGDEGHANQARRIGPSFINPPQASGVSLRNFKIQCAKYATISDIVIYCPFGYHSGVLTLAKWVREAQASLRKERLARGWGGLQYNVFVVTEPFRVFEERFPALVSVDSNGFDRNRIDFVDREREEMERMTQATEIHDNVWLGCTADAPGVLTKAGWDGDSGEDSAPTTPVDEQANPRCFSVCINCEEDRSLASSTCSPEALRNAAKHLDSADAHARIGSDTDKVLDSLHRDQHFHLDGRPACESAYDGFRRSSSRDGSIVLGPNGWMPKTRSVHAHTDAPTSQHHTIADAKDIRGRGLLRLDASSVVQLDFQTGSGGASRTQGWQDQMAKKLVDLCEWIQQQASPPAPEQSHRDAPTLNNLSSTLRTFRDGVKSPSRSFSPSHGRERTSYARAERRIFAARRSRRVLLHCPDGYTETSVLALAYLMHARELSLPEAYLDLQLRANRSFFVYPADVAVLEAVERLLQYTRAARRQSKSEAMDFAGDARRSRHATSKSFSGALTLDGHRTENRRMSLSASPSHALADSDRPSMLASMSTADMASGICRSSTPTPTKCRANVAAVEASESVKTRDWFDKSKFDGSFPSRILPFLYLGNLDHASNVDMLRVLGITHLVSVGETALEPPSHISAKFNSPRKENGRSRYQRASAKAALAEDPLTVPSCTYQAQGVTVLNVRNVSDDGIDSLRGTMREAVQFIEAARLSGGKVLVHCRVGVSRSTTMVLAYVMAHLDLGLVESYLLVRSRRLNIVIQPHLLFLWELRGWETFLHRAKQAQVRLLSGSVGSRDLIRGELAREPSHALSALSIRGCSARSEEGSGSYKSATSSPAGSPVATSMMKLVNAEAVSGAQHSGEEHLPGVEIGAGAGSVHGFDMAQSATMPFGSGSPTGVPYNASRLTWGHLAREIAELNSRYFV